MKFRNIIYSLLTEDQEGVYRKYFSDVKRETFIRIASADPKTLINDDKIIKLGSYYKFLIDMYRNGNLKFEDLPKATEYLELVYKYRMKIGQMKIETISDLYELVKDKIVKTNKSLSELISALDKSEYSVKLNEGSWFVVVPLTEKASAYLGANTEWCTTWGKYCLNPDYKDRTNHFNTYNPQGPLYIIINKENEADKYQLHFPSNQLKNPADVEIKNRPAFFNEKLEVKKYFFPSLYISDPSIDNVKSELTKGKKFLDGSDIAIYREVIFAEYGGTNPFVAALQQEDEDVLEKFITDENVSYSITRGDLEFEIDNLTSSLEGYDEGIRTLRVWEDNAYNDVSDNEFYDYRDNSYDTLHGYLKTYYEEHSANLIDLFGMSCKTFESYLKFLEKNDIYKNEHVRDEYIDEFTNGTGAALANVCREEINQYEAILDVKTGWSKKTITIPIEKVIEYIGEKEIYELDSLEEFMSGYIYHYDLPSGDYMDYPEYQYTYPTQDFMDNVFDTYFEKLHKELYGDDDPKCVESKKKFLNIFEKYFNGNDAFENEFVRIELQQPWYEDFSCEDGVKVNYLLNKKTNEKFSGYMQVDSFINYIQSEPLLEKLSLYNLSSDIL